MPSGTGSDPQTGALFVFRSRRGHAIKCLTYDGQGYWCCQKRLSQGRFGGWPKPGASAALRLSPINCTCCSGMAIRPVRWRRRCGARCRWPGKPKTGDRPCVPGLAPYTPGHVVGFAPLPWPGNPR
ncbi:MAG: IS66 family insertion sequence element accessory protein TnpB [Verrucomicrobiales bacterium]|nr:IS66 family insertion sequence element accessory protein TnpB [Verrucomicrobiales bacterium]